MSLSEQDGHFVARLTLRHGLTLHPAGYEFVLALLLISMRRATGKDDLQPLAVSFPHPRPTQLSNHKRLFGCPLHFEASAASLHFSKVQLSLPLIHASDAVSAALERAARAVMAGLPNRAELVVDVTSTINELLPTGRCDGQAVARALGMGSRTLQRRLRAEGTSFKQILDDQRQRVAMSYLQETKLSLNEISYLLAFANPQAFHRAFKRWTGTTATVMRKTRR